MPTPEQNIILTDDQYAPPAGPHRKRLRHFSAKLVIVSLFILVAAMFVYGVDILLLTFAGILFGVFLRYLARWVTEKTKLPVRWSVIAVSVGLLLFLGLAGWMMAPRLANQVDELFTALPKAANRLYDTVARYKWGEFILARAPAPEQVVSQNQGQIAAKVANYFRVTLTVIGGIVAIFFLGIFFAASPGLYINGVAALVPRHREARVREVIHNTGSTLECWLLGQFSAMAVVFVLTTLGLWLLKIDFALALGLIAGLLAFIPNIGPIVSAIPAVMIGLLQNPTQAIWVVVLYIVIQTVESYIITPLIQKRMVSLAPALVVFVQFLMGAILGTFALALATPLAAAGLVLVRKLYVEDFLGKDLSKDR